MEKLNLKTRMEIQKRVVMLVKPKNQPLSQYSEILNLFTPFFVIRSSGSQELQEHFCPTPTMKYLFLTIALFFGCLGFRHKPTVSREPYLRRANPNPFPTPTSYSFACQIPLKWQAPFLK
jgi:hypothetical protein